MAINVSLNAFTGAARNAGGALRVTGDGLIQKSSALRELFPTREMRAANRETMGQFLSALKTRYGEYVANLAACDLQGAIRADKPLTARAIRAVVGEAERIQGSLAMFLSGVDSSGKPIKHSLNAAIKAWETAHLREAALMTPEEHQTAKERIAKELVAGNPVCHNPEEMFQAVLNKDLRPPISGNVQIPGALTGAAAVQARATAEAFFTQHMGEMPVKELLRNQHRDREEPTFEKDLIRGTNLTVGNHRVANKAPNTPRIGQTNAQAVAENGYDEIARLLTGQKDARFANLSETQRKQVLLLSGLCSQEIEVPATVSSLRSLLDISAAGEGPASSPQEGVSRQIHLGKNNEGNFVVRYDAKIPVTSIPDSRDRRMPIDPARSRQDIHAELVISPNELGRLAELDWTDISTKNIPEDHRMHFEESHFSASLTLYAEE